MSDDLKPCPFCGSTHIRAEQYNNEKRMFCHDCEAGGPPDTYQSGVKKAWNTRPREAALEGEVSRADITETQLHAALEREQALRAWALEARNTMIMYADDPNGVSAAISAHFYDLAESYPVHPTEQENQP